MMLQVKKWSKYSLIFAALLLAVSCKDSSDPFVDPGSTPDPQWTITTGDNLPSSLTAIVRVSFAKSEGTLAAFMGNECCGIAEYSDGLYWLYVSPKETSAVLPPIQLRFYSPELKRIFVATETIPFQNDALIGGIDEPFTPHFCIFVPDYDEQTIR